jgi:hypothetical protein
VRENRIRKAISNKLFKCTAFSNISCFFSYAKPRPKKKNDLNVKGLRGRGGNEKRKGERRG